MVIAAALEAESGSDIWARGGAAKDEAGGEEHSL